MLQPFNHLAGRDAVSSARDTLKRFRSGFFILLLVTVVSLAWQHYGMDRVVEINGLNVNAVVNDDRLDEGASVARLERDGPVLRMHCNLVRQMAYPYCLLRLPLGTDTRGMDLTRFDQITLDVAYSGAGAHQVRLNMEDFEPGLSIPGKYPTNKHVAVELFTVPDHITRITVPFNLFYIAEWWKAKFKVPFEKTGLRYDNVVAIQLANGGDMVPGPYVLTLKALRFHGKWISMTQLLAVLVALWIAWPLTVAARMRRELSTSKAQLKLLQELNKALELEARELAGQVQVDNLTRVLNREGLRAFLMESASKGAGPMAVIFTDIDHFKSVNDTHGHAVGDLVLRDFAQMMATTVRSTDRVVRWGGEEFLIVCMNTTGERAGLLAEKLRTGMHAHIWPAGMRVTASFGVAEHLPSEELGEVIKRADAELYAAKRSGRDRVHVHGVASGAKAADVMGRAA